LLVARHWPAPAQVRLLLHQRQHTREDEPADTHRRGQCGAGSNGHHHQTGTGRGGRTSSSHGNLLSDLTDLVWQPGDAAKLALRFRWGPKWIRTVRRTSRSPSLGSSA